MSAERCSIRIGSSCGGIRGVPTISEQEMNWYHQDHGGKNSLRSTSGLLAARRRGVVRTAAQATPRVRTYQDAIQCMHDSNQMTVPMHAAGDTAARKLGKETHVALGLRKLVTLGVNRAPISLSISPLSVYWCRTTYTVRPMRDRKLASRSKLQCCSP